MIRLSRTSTTAPHAPYGRRSILAAILVIAGIVALVRGSVVAGIVLIIVGLLVGPGGVSIFD
jgi:hypothetical protein